jgi:hypothetical protein
VGWTVGFVVGCTPFEKDLEPANNPAGIASKRSSAKCTRFCSSALGADDADPDAEDDAGADDAGADDEDGAVGAVGAFGVFGADDAGIDAGADDADGATTAGAFGAIATAATAAATNAGAFGAIAGGAFGTASTAVAADVAAIGETAGRTADAAGGFVTTTAVTADGGADAANCVGVAFKPFAPAFNRAIKSAGHLI